jgi:hypothetical protein
MANKNKGNKEEQKVSSFTALADKTKVTLRLKATLAQLQQLDNKETITVPFKGRNLEITCKGKVE